MKNSPSVLYCAPEPEVDSPSTVRPIWPKLGATFEKPDPFSLIRLFTLHPKFRIFSAQKIKTQNGTRDVHQNYEVWLTPSTDSDLTYQTREKYRALWGSDALQEIKIIRENDWSTLVAETAPYTPLELPSLKRPPKDRNQGKQRENRFKRAFHSSPSEELVPPHLNLTIYTQLIKASEPLADLLMRLHDQEICLGGFSPHSFGIRDNRCDPLWAMPLYSTRSELSLSDSEVSPIMGYSPPETYGYFQSLPLKESDVFSFGMWLYYAMTGAPLLAETRRPFTRLPAPNVFEPSLMPELVAIIRRATSPYPSRRYSHMRDLWKALCRAISTYEERCDESCPPLSIEIGHEIHIGLLKGQYNPVNQDDLFLGYQPENERGLFVVTDGVSISEYGSGDIASGYVRQEAFETWRQITRLSSSEDEETLSEVSIDLLERSAQVDRNIIVDMLDRANRRIGDHINTQIPVFHGPPEGIMAATAVVTLIEGRKAMLASVGDSRIYLIRDHLICSLMVDDDLATHLIQMGQTPTQAQQTPSAAALINCVGEFQKNADQQLVPVKIHPQFLEFNLLPGDTFVLCSDGLPDYSGFDEEDAERRILEVVTSSFSAPRSAFELISLANRGGGGDNLSCIVLRFYSSEET